MKRIIPFIVTALLFCFQRNDFLYAEAEPQRIISLAPSTTEILFQLGLGDKVVAVTSFCNYPEEARLKEKVGTFSSPDIEKILSLHPDVILATGLEQAQTVEKLRQLQLPIYVSDPTTIEELFISIEEIGALTHTESTAAQLIAQMRFAIQRMKEKVAAYGSRRKPTVFIEIWHDPLMTAGKGSFVDELIRLAGGENIAFDAPRPYSYFSAEQVIDRNPDCIIFGYMAKAAPLSVLENRLGWKEISAVQNNRVYDDINPDLLFRAGPRLVEGLEAIHEKLYPDEEY